MEPHDKLETLPSHGEYGNPFRRASEFDYLTTG